MTKLASIYLIENMINHKKYIGFTTQVPKERWKRHISGNSECGAIVSAIKKYGPDNFSFDIIHQSEDIEYTNKITEPLLIKEYDTFGPNGYNLTSGGEGISGWNHTEEAKKKMSLAKKGLYIGEKNPACKRRKKFLIKFKDGHSEAIIGLKKFCRERNYIRSSLHMVQKYKWRSHRDIVGVEEIWPN